MLEILTKYIWDVRFIKHINISNKEYKLLFYVDDNNGTFEYCSHNKLLNCYDEYFSQEYYSANQSEHQKIISIIENRFNITIDRFIAW